jgi:cytochrome c peroxidase
MKKLVATLGLVAACSSTEHKAGTSADAGPAPTKQALGQLIFNDTKLSEPAGQSCATCHDATHSFVDGRGNATSEGVIAGRFGIRNAPSIAYAATIPELEPNFENGGGYSGGMFWDGRENTMARQVLGPLMNPLEMNNANAAAILPKLKAASYASQFIALYGDNALADPDTALANLGDAVAAFETVLPGYPRFSSKYDAYLGGKATLSPAEMNGLKLFEDKISGPCTPQPDGTNAPPCGCAQCHLDQTQHDGSPPLFTDFGYDNIGIPKNTANPFYALPPNLNPGGAGFIDEGLAAVLKTPQQMHGHFKAPTLRNIAQTAPYGHNGYFKTLKDIVHFYNTRDVPGAWAAPEVTEDLNKDGLGNLGLTEQNEDDMVSFLNTLTDGYAP